MKIMYTIFVFDIILQTVFAWFSGKFHKVICRTASRWFWQDTLTMLWDFPPILAINYLHRQGGESKDTTSRTVTGVMNHSEASSNDRMNS